MIRTSSSSSTLSPLAPPFTVYRRQPYRYPSPPSVPELNDNGSLDGEDSAPLRSIDESSASWIDPSFRYDPSPFRSGGAAENFMAYEDSYGSWHGKQVASSGRQVFIGADSSVWQDANQPIYDEKARDSCNNGLSYFQLPDPNLVMEERKTSKSNSCYDRYMSQLVACSPDPIVDYPATTCPSYSQVVTPANEISSFMNFAPRNCYSTAQDGNLLYNVDDNYVDYMLHNRKDTDLNLYSDSNKSYVKENSSDNKMEGNNGTGNYPVPIACSTLGSEATIWNSVDHSPEAKYGFRARQMNFTDNITSSSRPTSSEQTSLEILDLPNLAVDSPCWKGASVSRKYSFNGGKMIDEHEARQSKGSNDLNKGQKCLQINGQYSRASPFQEKDECLAEHSNTRCSLSIQGDFSPHINLYETDKNFHDLNAKEFQYAEVGEEKRTYFSCVINERSNEAKNLENDYDRLNRNVKESGQERTVLSASDSIPDGEGAHPEACLADGFQNKSSNLNLDDDTHVRNFSLPRNVLGKVPKPIDSTDPMGKCLTSGKDVSLLVKAVHGLSEVLLSSSDNVADWKECDHELVQLVIDNLESFSSRSKKGTTNCTSSSPGKEPSHSQVSVSKSNRISKKQSNTSTQVSVKDLDCKVIEKKEENPQALVYKKLWMEAEASLCSMKYELQLASMKLEMENYNSQTKAEEPVQATKLPQLNFMPFETSVLVNPVENDTVKSCKIKPKEKKSTEDDKDKSSVMSRLEVLKDRYARSNTTNIEDEQKCWDTENTVLKDLNSRLADLGLIETQPFEETISLCSDYTSYFGGTGDSLSPFSRPFISSTSSQRNPKRFIFG